MKYLFLVPPDPAQQVLIPVDAPVTIQMHDGLPYLFIGNRAIFDVDERNRTQFLPFIAENFVKTDVITVNLTDAPKDRSATTVKRGLEE